MARNIALSFTGSFGLNSSRISLVVAIPGREHCVAIKRLTSIITCSYFLSVDGTSFPALLFPPAKLRALIRASSWVDDMGLAEVALVSPLAVPSSRDSPLKCFVASSCYISTKGTGLTLSSSRPKLSFIQVICPNYFRLLLNFLRGQ